MRIRTKLTIASILPLGLFFIIGSTALFTSWQAGRAEARGQMAAELQQKVTDLILVTHYLLLRHEERPRIQLGELLTSLAELTARLQPQDPEEEVVVRRLRRNQEGLAFLFSRLVSLWEKGRMTPGNPRELEDRMTAQVLERIREMASDSEQFETLARSRATSVRERGNMVRVTSAGLICGLVALISLLIMRRTSTAISRLQKATGIVAAGDLDHEIPAGTEDELAELSRAFNSMAHEVKKSYDEVRKHAEQLEASNRELQDFAFVASHDLQEPLRKIQAFGDQLKLSCGGRLDAEELDYLERMQNAAVRMQALIQALLSYSRVASKAQPFSVVDLTRVALDAVGDLEASIRETEGQVHIDDLPTIQADPTQMGQLFQNLIGNALKFRGTETPVVRVYGQAVDHGGSKDRSDEWSYRIFVEDNGIGFDEKYLDRIFTPFQRLHGRGVYEGTGIGLAICRRITERHGGTITAKSTPGKGATFIVTLPMKQPEGGRA